MGKSQYAPDPREVRTKHPPEAWEPLEVIGAVLPCPPASIVQHPALQVKLQGTISIFFFIFKVVIFIIWLFMHVVRRYSLSII